jgi:hypothetical protein
MSLNTISRFYATSIVVFGFVLLLESMRPAFAQVLPSPKNAVAAPMPPEMSVQAYLAQQVPVPGMELDRFLAAVHGKFRQADADSNGEISQADVTLHAEIARAGTRALFAMQIMRADLNNDGAVTEDELRRVLQYDRRMINPPQQDPMRGTVDAQIRKLMAADINHDGRVTYAEAEAFFEPQPVDMRLLDRMSETARQFLKFAPSGKDVATLADVDAGAIAVFREIDTDGDGVISDAELKAFRAKVLPPPGVVRARAGGVALQLSTRNPALQPTPMGIACPMPKPSAAAKVVLIGSDETTAVSTVTIGSQDVAVGVGTITVEPGTEPIYLVVTSYRPTIWRLYGAVARIERLVLTSTMPAPTKDVPADKPLVGATGVPAERVTFLQHTECVGHFETVPSRQATLAAIAVKIDSGMNPAKVAGIYGLSEVSVPSGAIQGTKRGKLVIVSKIPVTVNGGDSNVIIMGDSTATGIDLRRFYPGGVVEIDPKSVVASMPVARYDVLPGRAGLAQLVKAGKLEVKNGEFLIKQKIRFPAELSNIYQVEFRLLKGVPRPDGNPGDSEVISDDTGARINFDTPPR